MHRNCCVCHVKLFRKSVSDHYSVDFIGKGRVFQLESLFSVSTPLYTSSLDFLVEFIISAWRFVIPVHFTSML